MRIRSVLTLAVIIGSMLLAPLTTQAAGSGYTEGTATSAGFTFYYNPRDITNPAAAGPEVAFYQSSGISGLRLGIHGCNGQGGPIYEQVRGTVQPVAYVTSPRTFCMLTYVPSGSGSFGGTLYWD